MSEPYCLAFVLCDAVHRDPATKKFTILGTFDRLAATAFPVPITLMVYFAITDAIGNFKLSLQLVDASCDPVSGDTMEAAEGRVFHMVRDLAATSPLEVLEEAVGVRFLIPKPGVYHCELFADSTPLMARRLTVQQVTPPSPLEIEGEE